MENLIAAIVLLFGMFIILYFVVESTGNMFFWSPSYRKGWKIWRKEFSVDPALKFQSGKKMAFERCDCQYPSDSEMFIKTKEKPFGYMPLEYATAKGLGSLQEGGKLVLECVISRGMVALLLITLGLGLALASGIALYHHSWRPLGIFGGISLWISLGLVVYRFSLRSEWTLITMEIEKEYARPTPTQIQTS